MCSRILGTARLKLKNPLMVTLICALKYRELSRIAGMTGCYNEHSPRDDDLLREVAEVGLEEGGNGLEDEVHVLLRRISSVQVDDDALLCRVEQSAHSLCQISEA